MFKEFTELAIKGNVRDLAYASFPDGQAIPAPKAMRIGSQAHCASPSHTPQ